MAFIGETPMLNIPRVTLALALANLSLGVGFGCSGGTPGAQEGGPQLGLVVNGNFAPYSVFEGLPQTTPQFLMGESIITCPDSSTLVLWDVSGSGSSLTISAGHSVVDLGGDFPGVTAWCSVQQLESSPPVSARR